MNSNESKVSPIHELPAASIDIKIIEDEYQFQQDSARHERIYYSGDEQDITTLPNSCRGGGTIQSPPGTAITSAHHESIFHHQKQKNNVPKFIQDLQDKKVSLQYLNQLSQFERAKTKL